MTSRLPIQCLFCKHWQSPLDRDDKQDVQICDAYPDGIPDRIWDGQADHRQEQPGDHGIRWEPDGDVEFPAYALDKEG